MNDLAVHPSGKLALSVGHDRTLRIWNLMAGRCAFITQRPTGTAQGERTMAKKEGDIEKERHGKERERD